jgi:hypothetical protein
MAAEGLDHLRVEVQGWLQRVAGSLPTSISVLDLGVRDKAPYKALAIREALIWRTEELARTAYARLGEDDLAAAILLTRGVVECAALMARLTDVVRERGSSSAGDLSALLDKMLFGWKGDPEFPEAFNVQTLIKHLDRRTPGVGRAYDHLSEIAHPNWSGVSGLFAWTDKAEFTTYFGHPKERRISALNHCVLAFSASLSLFELDYNNLAELMPGWLSELEQL